MKMKIPVNQVINFSDSSFREKRGSDLYVVTRATDPSKPLNTKIGFKWQTVTINYRDA